MALATIYAAGSKNTNNAQKAYEDYVQEKAHTVSGKPVTEAAQQALGPATKGQTFSSNYYDGNVTTKKYNADGTIAGTDVRPYEQTINKQSDGTIVTQQSPLSVTYKAPTKKITTVTKNNGEVYTFEGDDWVKYANDNGLDVGGVGAVRIKGCGGKRRLRFEIRGGIHAHHALHCLQHVAAHPFLGSADSKGVQRQERNAQNRNCLFHYSTSNFSNS